MAKNIRPDYMDADWSALIKDREAKWQKMWDTYKQQNMLPFFLWENANCSVSHAKGFRPRMLVYPVYEGSPRGILIICAGGGFCFKSSNEAKPVADYFYQAGLNVAILDYNTDVSLTIEDNEIEVARIACEDAKRAIRIIRYHAEDWNILEDRIAIGGFSAGGVVSGMAGTRFDYGCESAVDPVERMSCRPDAVILMYSSFMAATISAGNLSRKYDFDDQRKQVQTKCTDLFLRFDCPPFFVAQTAYDDPRGSMYLGIELANRGIPFEVHTFEQGPHGGGLYDGKDEDSPYYPHTSMWAELVADWLRMRGFCK